MEIRYAVPNDLDGLLDLLKAYHMNSIPEEERKMDL